MAEKKPKPQPVKHAPSRNARGHFAAGQSGNPNGRPKNEFCMTVLLREALQKTTIGGKPIPDGMTAAQAIVERFVEGAMIGTDTRFALAIFERIDGKVADKIIDLTPPAPLQVTIKRANDAHRKPKAGEP